MNKNMCGRLCVVLLVASMLSACAGLKPTPGCAKGVSAITINLKSAKINVAPENYCAKPGEAIPVNIRPPRQARGTVRTIAKSGNTDKPQRGNWLNRANDSYDNLIIIQAPTEAEVEKHCPEPATECIFRYSVEAPGKRPLDPMITIRKR
jgi:hypothetical protein